MRLRLLCTAALLVAASCGDSPDEEDGPCPRNLIRNDDGLCVEPEPAGCDPAGMEIVEVFIDPVGSDREAEFEFIEIAGPIGRTVDGLTLAVVDADARRVHEVALSGSFPADGLLVVGGPGTSADIDLGTTIDNGTGAIQLVDCEGRVVDAVAWGLFDNGSAFPGEGDPAGIAPEGSSLARCTGTDSTGDNRADFGLAQPSAGVANAPEDFADATFCSGGPVGCSVADQVGLRIEEVLYNPEGTDAGAEFIEIRGEPGTLLDGARLTGVNGGSGFELFSPITLAGTMDESGVFVVAGASVAEIDFPLGDVVLQNGPDTIQLYACDGRSLLDSVAYGNFDGEDEFAGEGSAAPPVAEGFSLSRCSDAADTNDNLFDFGGAIPTPGRLASADDFNNPGFCGGGGCTVGAIDAEINEVLYDPEGTDTGFEFVELRGTPGSSVSGARLVGINGGNGLPYGDPVFIAGEFGDDGLFVLGGVEVADADQELTLALQNGPDSLVLLDCDGETTLDAVAYGNFDAGQIGAGEGEPAPEATLGNSISRCAEREDTGDNATDFGLSTATPGAANDAFLDPLFCSFDPTACVEGEAVGMRINEVNPNPEGSDGDNPTEFVELRGAPGQNVTGLWLAFVNGSNGETYAPPTRLVGELDENGFFVLGQTGAFPDQELIHSLQNGPDSVQLLDCSGETLLDSIGYGAFGEDQFFGGEGESAPSNDGRSTARCEDVLDSNDNRADFGLADPTPGSPNGGHDDPLLCIATECTPTAPGTVLINEVLYDPEGGDGGGEGEFIELLGPPEMDVTGMRLYGINGSNGAEYIGPVVIIGSLDESGFLVAGGASIEAADMPLPATLQNGPDSLQLRGCDEAVIDAVAYGVFNETEFPAGEGEPAPDVADTSIGRSGPDSNDNATDFSVQETPSPGAANE